MGEISPRTTSESVKDAKEDIRVNTRKKEKTRGKRKGV
jgi:hypothetical protein